MYVTFYDTYISVEPSMGIAVCFSIYEIKELFVICRFCGYHT